MKNIPHINFPTIKRLKFDHNDKWYYFEIQMEHLIPATRLDLINKNLSSSEFYCPYRPPE